MGRSSECSGNSEAPSSRRLKGGQRRLQPFVHRRHASHRPLHLARVQSPIRRVPGDLRREPAEVMRQAVIAMPAIAARGLADDAPGFQNCAASPPASSDSAQTRATTSAGDDGAVGCAAATGSPSRTGSPASALSTSSTRARRLSPRRARCNSASASPSVGRMLVGSSRSARRVRLTAPWSRPSSSTR